jgi:hypothetical protein
LAHYQNTGRYLYITEAILKLETALEDLEDMDQLNDPNLILPDGVTKEDVLRDLAPFMFAKYQAVTNRAGGLFDNSWRTGLVPTPIAAPGPLSIPAQLQRNPLSPQTPPAPFSHSQLEVPFSYSDFGDLSETIHDDSSYPLLDSPVTPSNTIVADPLLEDLFNQFLSQNGGIDELPLIRETTNNVHPDHQESDGASNSNDNVATQNLDKHIYNWPWTQLDVSEEEFSAH